MKLLYKDETGNFRIVLKSKFNLFRRDRQEKIICFQVKSWWGYRTYKRRGDSQNFHYYVEQYGKNEETFTRMYPKLVGGSRKQTKVEIALRKRIKINQTWDTNKKNWVTQYSIGKFRASVYRKSPLIKNSRFRIVLFAKQVRAYIPYLPPVTMTRDDFLNTYKIKWLIPVAPELATYTKQGRLIIGGQNNHNLVVAWDEIKQP